MQRLYKIEKLCSETDIARLFRPGGDGDVSSALCYPLRATWTLNERRDVSCPRFLVSIPKKRLRHAVDRVRMRRVVREAYRLNRPLIPADAPLDIAFIYVASERLPYSRVEAALKRLLTRIGVGVAASSRHPRE